MKKYFYLLLFCCLATKGYTQEGNRASVLEDKKKIENKIDSELFSHELHLNALYLLLGFPEISYHKIINAESSIGVSLGFRAYDDVFYYTEFMLTPNYRFFFTSKRARGFFVELSTTILSKQTEEYYYSSTGYYTGARGGQSKLGWGLGIAIGGKFINRNNWIGELLLGLGRNFINQDDISTIYPRISISVGKRF